MSVHYTPLQTKFADRATKTLRAIHPPVTIWTTGHAGQAGGWMEEDRSVAHGIDSPAAQLHAISFYPFNLVDPFNGNYGFGSTLAIDADVQRWTNCPTGMVEMFERYKRIWVIGAKVYVKLTPSEIYNTTNSGFWFNPTLWLLPRIPPSSPLALHSAAHHGHDGTVGGLSFPWSQTIPDLIQWSEVSLPFMTSEKLFNLQHHYKPPHVRMPRGNINETTTASHRPFSIQSGYITPYEMLGITKQEYMSDSQYAYHRPHSFGNLHISHDDVDGDGHFEKILDRPPDDDTRAAHHFLPAKPFFYDDEQTDIEVAQHTRKRPTGFVVTSVNSPDDLGTDGYAKVDAYTGAWTGIESTHWFELALIVKNMLDDVVGVTTQLKCVAEVTIDITCYCEGVEQAELS